MRAPARHLLQRSATARMAFTVVLSSPCLIHRERESVTPKTRVESASHPPVVLRNKPSHGGLQHLT
jgi:hypothetical protein